GVVVSILARGQALDKMLEELLGKAIPEGSPDDPAFQPHSAQEHAAGKARWDALVGHPIEYKGTLLGGTPFDPASVKGKVVLVDFWGSWCGPCRRELPTVKKVYQKYHDKGFEIVGVCVEKNADDLKKFLTEEKLRWPLLFSAERKEQYFNQPMTA